jgi:uncharacterized surface anchored protein
VDAVGVITTPSASGITVACQVMGAPPGGTVTCADPTNATLPAGAIGTITLTVQAPTSVPVSPLTVANTVCATTTAQVSISDDCATHQIQVRKAYSTIAGRVFQDSTTPSQTGATGLVIYQPGVTKPIPGVTITLYAADSNGEPTGEPLATTTTNPDGSYVFTNLEAGDYAIVETQPQGWLSTGSRAGTINTVIFGVGSTTAGDLGIYPGVDVIFAVELAEGVDSVENNFAEYQPGSIGNLVWHDLDTDGVVDEGEPGIGTVEISLYLVTGGNLASEPTAVTYTDGLGSYLFTGLEPGTYQVEVTATTGVPTGLASTASSTPGTGDNTAKPTSGYQVTIGQGHESDLTADFGFGQAATTTLEIHKLATDQTPLEGASFQVLEDDNNSPGGVLVGGVAAPQLGSLDKFTIADLAPGIYWIQETKAPAGHRLLAAPIQIQVGSGTVTVLSDDPQASATGTVVEIVNASITPWALPFTGGSVWAFSWLALLAVLSACGVLLVKRRTAVR